jgi:hypothetical protein
VKRRPMASRSLARPRGRLAARHMRSTLMRYRHCAQVARSAVAPLKSSACYFAAVPAFGLRFSSAKLRSASHQPAPGRTSYWVRGGPRCRPGASLRNKPASAAPRPANANASRQRPSEGRGGRSLREVMGGGDKFGFVSNAPGDRCLGRDINEGLRDIVGRFV